MDKLDLTAAHNPEWALFLPGFSGLGHFVAAGAGLRLGQEQNSFWPGRLSVAKPKPYLSLAHVS